MIIPQDLSNLISPGTVPRPPITFRLVVPASQVKPINLSFDENSFCFPVRLPYREGGIEDQGDPGDHRRFHPGIADMI